MSPVADAYGKKGLAPVQHRLAMCRLAAAGTDNVMLDAWEAAQPGYTRTLQVSIDHRGEGGLQDLNGTNQISLASSQNCVAGQPCVALLHASVSVAPPVSPSVSTMVHHVRHSHWVQMHDAIIMLWQSGFEGCARMHASLGAHL